MISLHRQRIKFENYFLNIELPVMGYDEVRELQKKIVAARKNNLINKDVVLWLEHTPVFTYGRHAGIENLKMDPLLLEKRGICVKQSERGGDITFHGPGQLVVYPIIDLRAARFDAQGYVTHLEEVMIRTARDYGITSKRRSNNPGVWVDNRKIGSIGIAIRRGISFHGMSLNVNLDLTPFKFINPCGLTNITMTSLENELPIKKDQPTRNERSGQVEFKKVRKRAQFHMASIFEKDLVMISNEDIPSILKKKSAEAAA